MKTKFIGDAAEISSKWTPVLNSSDRIETTPKGRYKVITREKKLTIIERVGHTALGIFLTIISLGVAYKRSEFVRSLFSGKRVKEFWVPFKDKPIPQLPSGGKKKTEPEKPQPLPANPIPQIEHPIPEPEPKIEDQYVINIKGNLVSIKYEELISKNDGTPLLPGEGKKIVDEYIDAVCDEFNKAGQLSSTYLRIPIILKTPHKAGNTKLTEICKEIDEKKNNLEQAREHRKQFETDYNINSQYLMRVPHYLSQIPIFNEELIKKEKIYESQQADPAFQERLDMEAAGQSQS